MKSVTVKDLHGNILVKVVHQKNGEYSCIHSTDLEGKIIIEARDEQNKKIDFVPIRRPNANIDRN